MKKYFKFITYLLFFLSPILSIAQNSISTQNPRSVSDVHKKSPVSFEHAEGGLLYRIYIDRPGIKIKPGDFIGIKFIVKNEVDSIISSSYESGYPSVQILPKPQYKGDIFAALTLLSEGDSAIIKLNIDSIYKGHPKPPGFKGKYIIYTIKVEKVIAKGNLSDGVFTARYKSYMTMLADIAKRKEPIRIKKYIAHNKLNVIQTDSGLYYIITKEGTGSKPATGDTVVMNYTVKSITGKIIETSRMEVAKRAKLTMSSTNLYKPIRFSIGTNGMIRGVEEGIQLLSKGSNATLIIPSSLAYGEQGNGQIQPFTPLIFDVELIDIIHPAILDNLFKVSFIENFDDNKNLWPIHKGNAYNFAIANHKYVMASFGEGMFEPVIPTNISADNDYHITAILNHVSGVSNSGYGLTFSYKDSGNLYLFEISGEGNYRVCRFLDNQFYTILPWTATNKIIKGNGQQNKLRVWYQGGQICEFYINDNLVNRIDNFEVEGNHTGFVIENAQHLEVNSLIIEEKQN